MLRRPAFFKSDQLDSGIKDQLIKATTTGTILFPQLKKIDIRGHYVYELSQWETMLLCNIVSHWLSPYPEWSLDMWENQALPHVTKCDVTVGEKV